METCHTHHRTMCFTLTVFFTSGVICDTFWRFTRKLETISVANVREPTSHLLLCARRRAPGCNLARAHLGHLCPWVWPCRLWVHVGLRRAPLPPPRFSATTRCFGACGGAHDCNLHVAPSAGWKPPLHQCHAEGGVTTRNSDRHICLVRGWAGRCCLHDYFDYSAMFFNSSNTTAQPLTEVHGACDRAIED